MADDQRLQLLLETARGVIEVGSLAPDDRFFDLGATSVDAVRLVSNLADHGLLLDIEQVFEGKDFAEMAEALVTVEE